MPSKQAFTPYSTPVGPAHGTVQSSRRSKKGSWARPCLLGKITARRTSQRVLIVPCTLSFSLTLEAETLIDDALAEAGKSRYIITDDELDETRTVAHFARRVLNLDASVYVRFGSPLDVIGNPVNEDGHSLDPNGSVIDRRVLHLQPNGEVNLDEQGRDQQYTIRLSHAITQAYQSDCIALNTHVAALAVWRILQHRYPLLDDIQRASLRREDRMIQRSDWFRALTEYSTTCGRALNARDKSIWPFLTPQQTYWKNRSIDFRRSTARKRLQYKGQNVDVAPKLILYYANRLRHISFPKEALSESQDHRERKLGQSIGNFGGRGRSYATNRLQKKSPNGFSRFSEPRHGCQRGQTFCFLQRRRENSEQPCKKPNLALQTMWSLQPEGSTLCTIRCCPNAFQKKSAAIRVGALAGPALASEIFNRRPIAMVVGSPYNEVGRRTRKHCIPQYVASTPP